MSSESVVIRASDLSKCYQLYENPGQRLQQFLMPRLYKSLGLAPQDYYKEFWALRSASFEIAKGETFGIVGRNGSGKSTLLQLLCGTLSPTGGHIQVAGKVAALLELGAGFSPEFTGRENVFLNGAVFGIDRAQMLSRFSEIEAFADIGDFIDQPLKTYSSGMAVRLAFSVAMHVDADILVVDEALSVGDFAFQAKCMRRLNEFVSNGGTLLFVSHDIGAVKNLCSRALYLRGGNVRAIGPSDEICDLYLTETNLDEGLAGVLISADQDADAFPVSKSVDAAGIEAFRRAVAPFRRHASSRCEFIGAEIVDAGGNPARMAEWSQDLKVRAWLNVIEPIESLVVAFYLRDRMQIDLLGTNTEYEGIDLSNLRAGECIEVDFSFRNCLRAGEYGLCLIAADRSITTSQYYDWIDVAATLQTSDRPGQTAWALFNPGIVAASTRTGG